MFMEKTLKKFIPCTVEKYLDEKFFEVWNNEKNNLSHTKDRRKELCENLGFDQQIIEKKFIPYPLLSKEELLIWNWYLPTEYSYAEYQWNDYTFDSIPTEALEEIEKAKPFFQDMIIRTPEIRKTSDPIVIGKNMDDFYIITRWGESLIDFEKIREKHIKSNESDPPLDGIRGREKFSLCNGMTPEAMLGTAVIVSVIILLIIV